MVVGVTSPSQISGKLPEPIGGVLKSQLLQLGYNFFVILLTGIIKLGSRQGHNLAGPAHGNASSLD